MSDMMPSPNMVAASSGIRSIPANFGTKPPNTFSASLADCPRRNGGHEQLCVVFVEVVLEFAHSALEDR